MNKNLRVILGFTICLTSCASSPVDYKYYGIWPSQGLLTASEPKDDLPLWETCEPDAVKKGKCIGMLSDEFFKMREELFKLRSDIENCKRGN